MVKHLFTLLLLVSGLAQGQIFSSRDGAVKFTSEAPLELIKAQSSHGVAVLDCNTRNVAFSIDIDSFDGFNSALQKEHFRENYMESTRYPKATFKGKIIEEIDLTKKGTSVVRAKGMFNIHGIEKEKIVKVKLTVRDKDIVVDANFSVLLEDHEIKIPKIVNQKIASEIGVEVNAMMKPKA